jgi:hypothetical protein
MTEYLFLAAIDADRGDEKKEVEACEKLELKNVATLLRRTAEIRYSAISCDLARFSAN